MTRSGRPTARADHCGGGGVRSTVRGATSVRYVSRVSTGATVRPRPDSTRFRTPTTAAGLALAVKVTVADSDAPFTTSGSVGLELSEYPDALMVNE